MYHMLPAICLLITLFLASCAAPSTAASDSSSPVFAPLASASVIPDTGATSEEYASKRSTPEPREVISVEHAAALAELARLEAGREIISLMFSPDGASLAAGVGNSCLQPVKLMVWDVYSGESRELLPLHTDAVWSLTFSPDGDLLASGSRDGTVRLWDTATDEIVRILDSGVEPTHINEHCTRITDKAVWAVAFSPDGASLAVGRGDPWVGPGAMELYDLASGDLLRQFEPAETPPCCSMVTPFGLDFSPDGTLLASANGDGSIRLWDPTTGQETAMLGKFNVFTGSVRFSPDGRLLVGEGIWSDCDYGEICDPEADRGDVRFWDVATGEPVSLLTLSGEDIYHAAFSPDGRLAATLGPTWNAYTAIWLWDTATGTKVAEFRSQMHADKVMFSPDGTLLVVGGSEGVIALWGVPSDR